MPAIINKGVVSIQKFTGMDGLLSVLRGLPKEMASTILADGVRVGAKPLQQSMKNFAPRKTGALRKSISIKVIKKPSRGTAVAVVGPSKQRFKGGKKLKKGQSTDNTDQPSRYAHLVEFGHHARGGGYVPAHPFVRPAIMSSKDLCGVAVAAGISKGLVKAVTKYKKGK